MMRLQAPNLKMQTARRRIAGSAKAATDKWATET
jgi:hypothetical protein